MFDDDEADLDDSEVPDWDEGEDEDEDTMPCPYCQAPVYEDTVSCPRCGNYLSEEDVPRRQYPWWVIAGLIAALAVALMWVFTP